MKGNYAMNFKLLVDTAMLAGEIMLSGGAETFRVEDTMTRILKTSCLERCEVFVVSTGIVLTLDDSTIDAISMVRRVEERSTNLGNISVVNDISRKLCNGVLSVEEAYDSLRELRKQKRYPNWLIYICLIITTAASAVILGSSALECMFAGINGILIVLSEMLYKKVRINRFVNNMFVCGFIAFATGLFHSIPGIKVEIEPIIAGSIMPLLPGVAITNAIRDTLQGDYMSGAARVIEAFVIAASLAVGIGVGLSFSQMFLHLFA